MPRRANRRAATGVDAERRIVDAAIICIEKEGLNKVTIRSIARAAGVNSAAISYYFRSKEKLIEQALKTTLANAFEDWEGLLREGTKDSRESLRSVLTELAEGTRAYPGLVKAHLYDSFVSDNYNTLFVRRFTAFFAILKERTGAQDAVLVQLLSAILMPGVFPGLFRKAAGFDLSDADARAAYVESLIERYLLPRRK